MESSNSIQEFANQTHHFYSKSSSSTYETENEFSDENLRISNRETLEKHKSFNNNTSAKRKRKKIYQKLDASLAEEKQSIKESAKKKIKNIRNHRQGHNPSLKELEKVLDVADQCGDGGFMMIPNSGEICGQNNNNNNKDKSIDKTIIDSLLKSKNCENNNDSVDSDMRNESLNRENSSIGEEPLLQNSRSNSNCSSISDLSQSISEQNNNENKKFPNVSTTIDEADQNEVETKYHISSHENPDKLINTDSNHSFSNHFLSTDKNKQKMTTDRRHLEKDCKTKNYNASHFKGEDSDEMMDENNTINVHSQPEEFLNIKRSHKSDATEKFKSRSQTPDEPLRHFLLNNHIVRPRDTSDDCDISFSKKRETINRDTDSKKSYGHENGDLKPEHPARLHHQQQLQMQQILSSTLQQHVFTPNQLQQLMKHHTLITQQQQKNTHRPTAGQHYDYSKKQLEQMMQQLQEQLQMNLFRQTHLLQQSPNGSNPVLPKIEQSRAIELKKKNSSSSIATAPSQLAAQLQQKLLIEQQELIQQFQFIQRQYLMHQGMNNLPLLMTQQHHNQNQGNYAYDFVKLYCKTNYITSFC
jgi:hypothetical protein